MIDMTLDRLARAATILIEACQSDLVRLIKAKADEVERRNNGL